MFHLIADLLYLRENQIPLNYSYISSLSDDVIIKDIPI